MQRALRNMLMTENGTEKLDNELITTLLENITTLALNRSRYPGFHQQYVPLTAFQTSACTITLDQCCVLIVRRRNNQTK